MTSSPVRSTLALPHVGFPCYRHRPVACLPQTRSCSVPRQRLKLRRVEPDTLRTFTSSIRDLSNYFLSHPVGPGTGFCMTRLE
ncbi:hypothetical protein GALMADRAFT_243988 [Galerina marginata CBS 339.88]|uniref:Uncharacterized protein n=1 Tax=Galerina marginata (strain CBS 339.88) TaxID=685588 RepID=A0A067TF96_GALM3|nr:hypothetical protein GALMADRAFT_243988 [Galerina marginata CBS 339.88]